MTPAPLNGGMGAARTLGNVIQFNQSSSGSSFWSLSGTKLRGKIPNPMRSVRNSIAKSYWGGRVTPQLKTPTSSFGSGSGYSSWYKSKSGRMPANHLGATGDLALALNKSRHSGQIHFAR